LASGATWLQDVTCAESTAAAASAAESFVRFTAVRGWSTAGDACPVIRAQKTRPKLLSQIQPILPPLPKLLPGSEH
jgi:hypothetical protein